MTNEHIELVKRWQAGGEVSVEALQANADAAWDVYASAYAAAAADDALYAAYAAAEGCADAAADAADAADAGIYDAPADDDAYAAAADAAYWVKRYEETTNEK